MRLGGEMHHGIDLLLGEDVVDEVGTLYVALDELEIGQILDVLEIIEAGAVIELVINDDCEKARKERYDSRSVMECGCREVGFITRKVRHNKNNSDANLRETKARTNGTEMRVG